MKVFKRSDATSIYEVGDKFKRQAIVKRFSTEDGMKHEFTTFGEEGHEGVAVIALTPDHQVVISRQFRAGRERYVDDIPGGSADHGEDLQTAARRELLEESGYRAGELRYIGKYSWDAYSNYVSHYFLATNCVPDSDRVFEQIEADQGLESTLISIQQLIDNAKGDNMTDVAAVLMAYDYLIGLQSAEEL